ncbi:hypothetical protein ACIQV3_35800 [Streptomyces sp. NPDC099050]|uniref:hypothetical protein n=1 Tax=Streptomyces sp. NPDC099050 TaxID=3366100 RepID=UPI0037F254B0
MSGNVYRPGDQAIGLDYIEFDAPLARDGSCKPATKAGYMALATFASTDDHTTMDPAELAQVPLDARRALLPYVDSIGTRMGRTESTVKRALADLEARKLLITVPQVGANGAADANVYHLTDRERWAERTLERAQQRNAALAAGQPWPPRRGDGPPVPRVQRDPGFDFIKLDAPTVGNGDFVPNFKAVYAAVASFVHGTKRGTNDRPPSYAEIQKCTGLGRSTVASNIGDMVDIGLLVLTERYDDPANGGGRLPSGYLLLDGKWWATRALERSRQAEEENPQVTGSQGWVHELDGGVGSPAGRGWGHELDGGGFRNWTGVGSPAGRHYKKDSRSEQDQGGDGRRPSAGGLSRAGAHDATGDDSRTEQGGSAAVTKKSGAKKFPRPKAVTTKPGKPVAGEADVYAALDALKATSGAAARIPVLRRAVRALLGHDPDARGHAFTLYPRTVEHAVARLSYGWYHGQGPARSHPDYRGCDQCTPSGCKASREDCDRIVRPVGYLRELLVAQDCERPDCERGLILGTDGDECRSCERRKVGRIAEATTARLAAERETAQAAEREQRVAALASRRDADHDAALTEDAHRAQAAAEAAETARLRELVGAELAAAGQAPAVPADVPGPRTGTDFPQAAGRGRRAAKEQTVRAELVAKGLVGTALDTEVRRRMADWKTDRNREAQAADMAARAARAPGAWPAVENNQATDAPF